MLEENRKQLYVDTIRKYLTKNRIKFKMVYAQSGSEIHGHMAQFFAITVAQKFTAMWFTFSLTFTLLNP